MKIIAYLYSDPLLESPPEPNFSEWEVEKVYRDLGGRQQLGKLLEDCQTEPPEYLLVRRVEELGDSLTEIGDCLAQLESLGIELISIAQSPTSYIRADLLKLLQEIQKYQRSRRIRQGHARNRLKASPPPGKAPYGYRRGKDKYILDKSAAPVVKDFFERFLIYGSLRGAVRYLAKKYGKKISVSTGRRWLTNPVYRGDTAYQNNEIISNTHVGIISREEGAQIDRLLRRNRRMSPRSASANRSLAGLVVCAECQSPMTVARVTTPRQAKEYLYLRPINCAKRPKCRAIAYEEVLQQTIATICRELPKAVAEMDLPDMGNIKVGIKSAIASKQDILAQLPSLCDTGILDTETSELRTYKLRTEIASLQQQLAQLPPVNLRETAQAVSIPQFWLDLSESERRFYFREFIRQIQLSREDTEWQLQVIFIF
ncbi:recombinase family protein [Aerosakkonema funiforme]|uniref:Recombinase family protein n=1 Tax=Aerosakkonema funiforme FACHB-1375 TaxID=2949571 RepID=A0A926ZGL7_9CYAN|nr:recombinase family protein [Aerosakkonema funiforme]MBD2181689.1 recombinase family protein [Aerosakkonema funiforme FACHB-1375]